MCVKLRFLMGRIKRIQTHTHANQVGGTDNRRLVYQTSALPTRTHALSDSVNTFTHVNEILRRFDCFHSYWLANEHINL